MGSEKSGKKRIRLSPHELREALDGQLVMLHKSCARFDQGDTLEAKQIAVHLRTLWHHNPPRSFGLAAQLNLVNEVVDTAFIVPPAIIGPEPTEPSPDEYRLFAVAISGKGAYVPVFDHGPAGVSKSPFKQWWEGNVISDGEGHKFTRKDVVLNVVNTDGGAHVDPELDENYYALTRKTNLRFILAVPTGEPNKFKKVETPSPVAVTLRQIGHETLKTLVSNYNYDGRFFYPGTSIAYLSAGITPSDELNDTQ